MKILPSSSLVVATIAACATIGSTSSAPTKTLLPQDLPLRSAVNDNDNNSNDKSIDFIILDHDVQGLIDKYKQINTGFKSLNDIEFRNNETDTDVNGTLDSTNEDEFDYSEAIPNSPSGPPVVDSTPSSSSSSSSSSPTIFSIEEDEYFYGGGFDGNNSSSSNFDYYDDEAGDEANNTVPSNSYSNPNTSPLTPTQYLQCLMDLTSSDSNLDSRLTRSEYLNFISTNALHNGYLQWNNDTTASSLTLANLPMEYSLIFHTTSCECAHEDGADSDCCVGDNEHVKIYYGAEDLPGGNTIMGGGDASGTLSNGGDANVTTRIVGGNMIFNPITGDYEQVTDVMSESNVDGSESNGTDSSMEEEDVGITAEQDQYTRRFCTEVNFAHGATKQPTEAPTTYSPTMSTVSTFPPTAGSLTLVPTVIVNAPTSSSPSAMNTVPTISMTTSAPVTPTTNRPSSSVLSTLAPILNTESPTMPSTSTETSIPSTTSISPPSSANPTTNPSISSSSSISTESSPDVVSIFLQYGISSNCGVTGVDILDGNGNTISGGLVSATENVVVGILNTTFPRAEGETNAARKKHKIFEMGRMKNIRQPVSSTQDFHASILPSNTEVENQNKRKRKKKKKKRQSQRNERHLSHLTKAKSFPLMMTRRRNLVYYTPTNPIVITDVEDVLDQACPAGVNCMRVYSTVKLVLEEGDDAEEIENAITEGFQEAFSDGSFFQAIPPDTIFCPGETPPPNGSSSTNAPATQAPTLAKITTSVPSARGTTKAPVSSPLTPPPTRGSTNVPPWALPDPSNEPTTTEGDETVYPTFSPSATPTLTPVESTKSSFSPTNSASFQTTASASAPTTITIVSTSPTVATPSGGNLAVQVTYDIANDCGLDANAVMDEVDNTLKTGLIQATKTTAIGILNATFPRTNDNRLLKGLSEQAFVHSHLSSDIINKQDSFFRSRMTGRQKFRRYLVYYTEAFPITIDRIIDITEGCAEGSNCLLIISTITAVLEPGDDAEAVNKALVDGMSDSFQDGSFFENIPSDTVICPERRDMRLI